MFTTDAIPLLTAAGALILLGLVPFLPFFRPRRPEGQRLPWLTLVGTARVPILVSCLLLGARLVSQSLENDALRTTLTKGCAILLIGAMTWVCFRIVDGVETVLFNRYDISVSDNLRARQIHTLTRVLSRTAQCVIIVIGAGAILMTFPNIKQLGASVLASAGIASLAIGLAARPALENIIAGIQIAITQPITLDDVVIIEGEWGRVEEIESTYVVVRIWDDRRLIVPLGYFMQNTFQNWTRRTARLLGTVFVRCDYTVDVDAVRTELTRVCTDHPKWDKRVAIVQVTDITERTLELRALVSAADASSLWDLRVAVREALVRFLRDHEPEALPLTRNRIDWVERNGYDHEPDSREHPFPSRRPQHAESRRAGPGAGRDFDDDGHTP